MTTVDLSGGVAVITGAAGGLGAGIARAAAARGMKLALADINADALHAFAAELRGEGVEVVAIPTDISDAAAVDRLAAEVHERFGSVRLLVNNAGVEIVGRTWELSAADWDRVMRINVLGPILGTRAFAPQMVAAANPAIILNIASLGGLGMMPMQAPYIVSKHAVLSFSENLYLELAHAAPMVRVAVALPGPVDTDIFRAAKRHEEGGAAARMRETMAAMLTGGMAPREAGDLILDRAVAGDFWIGTHPEMLESTARQRADYLISDRRPVLDASMENLLASLKA